VRIPAELLNKKCTLTPCSGMTPNGPGYGTPITDVSCYVEFNVELSSSKAQNRPKGEQRVYGTLLYFNDSLAIPETLFRDGQVSIVGDDKTYEIVVANKYTFAGTTHWEVELR
jgi:hypothetical protein